jgi:large subunit ribosomal protein L15
MQAHQLKPPPGARHAKRRVGRGNAGGTGTYSGKGLKGQKARAGNKPRRFFEGGQTRMMKRLPHRRGFTNLFRVEYQPVNLSDLRKFDAGTDVTPELLKERRVVRSLSLPVKVLGTGEIDRALTVTAPRFSASAKAKIEAAGGTVVETNPRQVKDPATSKKKRGKKAKPEAKAEEEAPKGEEAPAEAAEEPKEDETAEEESD